MKKIISILLCLSMLLGFSCIAQAESIEFDETISGVISENEDENKYNLYLSDSGMVGVKFIAEDIEAVNLKIFDEAGQEVWSERPWWNSTSKQISFSQDVELTSGGYVFIVSEYSGNGSYDLELTFEETNESFAEEQSGSNNSFKTASEIEVNETYIGQIAVNDETDNYSFTLENSGGFELSYSAENIEAVNLKIYDEDGQEIWSERTWWNSTSKQISFSQDVELTSGTYYFAISRYNGNGAYDFELSFEEANESFSEEQNGSNNSFKTASEIEVNETYIGQIAVNDETDNYSFTLENSGGFELSYSAENIEAVNLKIYDEDGQEIWSERPWWNSTSKQISFSQDVELTSGAYYFAVSRYNGNGTYDFELSFEEANESFAEEQNGSNNSFKTANEIEVNETYIGQIAVNDETDNYILSLNDSSEFELVCSAENIEAFNIKIYDEDGQEVWSERPWWNSASKEISYKEKITLSSGTYYLSFSRYNGCGVYEFAVITDGNSYPDTPDEPDVPDEPTYDEDDEITSFDSKVSEWAKDEVEEAYENDLIPETIIGEDLTEHITRAEFAAIAVQLYEELSGIYAPADETPFVDVNWNENIEYINKAYVLGITSGTSKTTFEPDIDITREQLATMLCRTIKKYSFDGWTLEDDSDYYLDTSGVSRFADDNEISDYAKPSVYYMAKFGIINGVGNNKFAPRNITSYQEATGYATATREQAILMSLRIFNVSEIW